MSPPKSYFSASLFLAFFPFGGITLAQPCVYQGVYVTGNSSLSNITAFESQSGKTVSIVNFFNGWVGLPSFPTAKMDEIRLHGSIPLLSWEPWDAAGGVNQSSYQLQDIINGNYDSFIVSWANAAKAWGNPFFLRFMHEMNGNWYPWGYNVNGNTAGQYKAAWRHVHDLFQSNGVTNVTWVWCVNVNYSGSPGLAQFYPGDQYVDWISLDGYNRGTLNGYSWKEFSALCWDTVDELISVSPGKPIMVAENGCVEQGGDKAQWFRNALKYDLKFVQPRIKAICYFNLNNAYNNLITSSEAARAAYAESVGLSYYANASYSGISESPIQPLLSDAMPVPDAMPPFVAIVKPARTIVPAGQVVEIKINASDKSSIQKVEVYIDGVLKQTENYAPYSTSGVFLQELESVILSSFALTTMPGRTTTRRAVLS